MPLPLLTLVLEQSKIFKSRKEMSCGALSKVSRRAVAAAATGDATITTTAGCGGYL